MKKKTCDLSDVTWCTWRREGGCYPNYVLLIPLISIFAHSLVQHTRSKDICCAEGILLLYEVTDCVGKEESLI